MNRREFTTSLLTGAGVIAAPSIARSQNVYELKLGHFISPKQSLPNICRSGRTS